MFHNAFQHLPRNFRFTKYLLLILAIFTATFFIYRDLGIRMILGFGVLALFLLIHLLRCLRLDQPPKLQPVHLPYLALVLVILLNYLRPDSRHNADSVAYIIAMLVSFGFVLLAAPSPGECRLTLKTLTLAGFLMAGFVVFFLIFDDLFWNTIFHVLSPTAQDYLLVVVPMGYAITLGGCTFSCYILFLGMASCCASLYNSAVESRVRFHTLLSYCFFLLAMLLVGRRGELLGALVCSALLILAMCPRHRRWLLIFGSILTLAAVLCLVLAFLPQIRQISFLQRYVETIENILAGRDASSGRFTLYRVAIAAFRENPLFGIGWDQFCTLVPQNYLNNPVISIEDAHCIYLQFLCETGITGALLIVAPLLYYYWQVCAQFRRLKRQRTNSPEHSLAFRLSTGSLMLQSFLLFVGIYDPNFQKIVFWSFYSLSILLLIAALGLEGHRPNDPVSRLLDRFLDRLRPGLHNLWQTLRTPWKEGK